MNEKDVKITPGNIPPASSSERDKQSKNLHIETTDAGKDIIPDEVPRTDGPGGE